MSAPASTKADAQRRADQIRAFRAEVDALAREGVEAMPADRAAAVAAHHEALLAGLSSHFDIDRTEASRRMSLGMRLASAFGAAALTAAIVSFFYRIWGSLDTPAQIALLTAAPMAALTAMVIAARRERTLYVASLCAIVACGAFVLQTILLGNIFNLPGSVHVLATWAVFGLAVSWPYRFTLPFAVAVAVAISYVAAVPLTFWRVPWTRFATHLETILVPAAIAYALWPYVPRELQVWMRGVSLAIGLLAVLVLSTFEGSSLLPLRGRATEILYQVVAAVLAVAVIRLGVRRSRGETLVVGAVFAALFLFGRFVDWWWDWMPKYLFFLILAAVAIAWLWGLGRLRKRMVEGAR